MIKNKLMLHTAVMTAVNLLMRTIGVYFNSYLTNQIGSAGMGTFSLLMSVYSLAVTFSCAGIKLAVTRISVEIRTLKKYNSQKSLSFCITYGGICGCIIGFALFVFSDFISLYFLISEETAFPLKVLSLSLPFVSMSSALSGYFTAYELTPYYSAVQISEQIFKISVVMLFMNGKKYIMNYNSVIPITVGMTASEIFSFILANLLKKIKSENYNIKCSINIFDFMRIALPDAIGSCVRSILLTVEHILIPKGLLKSGTDSKNALSLYGIIHGMAMPVILYPSAVLSSFSALLVPNLAAFNELGDKRSIKLSVKRNLKRTMFYSSVCSIFFFLTATQLSELIYKTKEAAKYIRILSPLVPIMYTDMITDGMLKGLDRQTESMKYNIIDSAMCVILVLLLIPRYSVNGYIFIMYISELLNFTLSITKLCSICGFRYFQALSEGISRLFRLKRYSAVPSVCEYQSYQVRAKRSQDL